MASDSQWTDDNEKGICRKVWRIQGALIGFAGDIKTIEQCKVWFRKGKAGPPPRGDVAALILTDKLISWTPGDGFFEHTPQFAIGTGSQAARAAMMAGANVREAVRIACLIDAQSGGRVRLYQRG